MTADTFDPTACASAAECVQALKEQGVAVGHRMGARVFGLGLRGVRFSLAFLEEAAAGGPAGDVLMDPAWNRLGTPADPGEVQEILQDRPALLVRGEGLCHVLTPDEYVPDSALATVQPAGSLLPSVLGAPDVTSFHGVLWDRRRMEEAALALLDAEDPKELVEAFRYLFRATHACGQDPTGLLVTAFRRGRLELSREAATLVREHLSRDFGRALGDLLSRDPARMRDALFFLTSEEARGWTRVLEAVLLPALTPLVGDETFRSVLFPKLPDLAPLVGQEPAVVESFLDAVLARLPEVELNERFAVSYFLVTLRPRYPGVVPYLLRRLRATADPHLAVFYGNVLARQDPAPVEKAEVVDRMVALFRDHGRDPALLQRLRATFRLLGAAPLERLSRSPELPGDQRTWLVHLWQDYRQEGVDRPPEAVFVEFATHEVLSRNRGSVLALVRTGQLTRPELLERLRRLEEPRAPVLAYLLDEAFRLEEPDDEPVLDLLGHLGLEALDRAFTSVREEAALESGGEAGRLLLFGRLARRMSLAPAEQDRVRGMVQELLSFPLFGPEALPTVWTGLGHVGAVEGLGEELRSSIVERLGAHLEIFPEARVEALLGLYPRAEEPVRRRVEVLLRDVLSRERPDRKVLRACLEGLERLLRGGPLLLEAEPLVMELCRTVLWKSREGSVEEVMLAVLDESAEGDGVQIPGAWSREDRDQGLRILGAVACHPDTPERLHRMVVVRLFSFLEDWLEAVDRGRDLYGHRDTPLWEIMREVLEKRPGEKGKDLGRRITLRLLELQRRHPGHLALARRESAQRFLLDLVRRDGGSLRVRGVELDLPRTVLHTLMDVALQAVGENRVTAYLLEELAREKVLREPLQQELVGFLSRLEPS